MFGQTLSAVQSPDDPDWFMLHVDFGVTPREDIKHQELEHLVCWGVRLRKLRILPVELKKKKGDSVDIIPRSCKIWCLLSQTGVNLISTNHYSGVTQPQTDSLF